MPETPRQSTKKGGLTYNPEILYPFWAEAGGQILPAQRLAADAGEKRVPKTWHAWARYAEKFGFAERLKQEQKERWAKYHAEREANQQGVLDRIAHTFEQMADHLMTSLQADFEQMRKEPMDPGRLSAEKRLAKLFGTMDAVDKFFRMYLRARELPEKISKTTIEGTVPVSYPDVEEPQAKSPEEARKLAENL